MNMNATSDRPSETEPRDAAAGSDERELWCPIDTWPRIAFATTMVVAAALLLPKVVWAPLFGDPGEVQLTAAVGGIGHPPGQAGIITLLRFFCIISPFDPHLTVSGVNALFCLGVVAILMHVQLRSGAHPVAAGMVSLLFLINDLFWHAATLPETYGTCFILLAGSILAYLSWVRDGRPWKFWLAAVLFLYLVVNRAPTLTFLLSFVAVAVVNPDVRRRLARRPIRRVFLLGAIGLGSLCVMLGSLWLRDVPGSSYNYLDQSAPSQPDFPAVAETAGDRWERIWWLVSARQYDYMFHPTPRKIAAQWKWLTSELGWRYPLFSPETHAVIYPVLGYAALAIVLMGVWHLWKVNRSVAVFAIAMLPAGVIPILLIRVIGNTTLLPNVLFAYAWLFSVGLSRIMQWSRSAVWHGLLIGAVGYAAWLTADPDVLVYNEEYDARPFIREVDLESLPPNATLIAFDVLPLIYVQEVYGVRPDIDILLHYGRLNREYLETLPEPIFTTVQARNVPGVEFVGEGRVRRIRLVDGRGPDGAGEKE
jgi:hypothetical protein